MGMVVLAAAKQAQGYFHGGFIICRADEAMPRPSIRE
jgi:hypothetical protein